MSQFAEPFIPDEAAYKAGKIRNPVKVQWRHLVSGSPPSRGRCLDPGSRQPSADLAGMT